MPGLSVSCPVGGIHIHSLTQVFGSVLSMILAHVAALHRVEAGVVSSKHAGSYS